MRRLTRPCVRCGRLPDEHPTRYLAKIAYEPYRPGVEPLSEKHEEWRRCLSYAAPAPRRLKIANRFLGWLIRRLS